MKPARDKYRDLLGGLGRLRRALVAFSGGVDSTLLLYAARQALGDAVLAVTLAAPYMSGAELEEARRTAAALGVRHQVVEVPFPEALRDNPPNRCYLCKRALFDRLMEVARGEGIAHVLDGTNHDDLDDYRPGLQALRELGVESPLLEAGLTKRDIRDLARENGLAWDKPATPCLLTRIPHGVWITEAELRRIDQAETFLRSLGFAAVRLRSHGDLARIEVPEARVAELVATDRRQDIRARLGALGYRYVTVDLAGYRMGSLNELGEDTKEHGSS